MFKATLYAVAFALFFLVAILAGGWFLVAFFVTIVAFVLWDAYQLDKRSKEPGFDPWSEI